MIANILPVKTDSEASASLDRAVFSYESSDYTVMKEVLFERLPTLHITPSLRYNAQLMEIAGDRHNRQHYNEILITELASLRLLHNSASNNHTITIIPHTTPFYIGGISSSKEFLIAGTSANDGKKIIAPVLIRLCDIIGYFAKDSIASR